MSALGGIIRTNQKAVDPRLILNMSRAMMRSAKARDAYLNGSIGIFHNDRLSPQFAFQRQPLTLTRNEKNYTLALDGVILGVDNILSPSPHEEEWVSPEELILEAYLSLGIDFVGTLQGSFALALCDESRGELFLARDRNGSRPLFYATDGESLAFASEIKALFRFLPDTAVFGDRLRAHLIAPWGTYRPEEFYRDIFSLPPGHCGVFSRLGMSVFPYETVICSLSDEESESSQAIVPVNFSCHDQDTLRRHLTEALFAFDYPQFDPWIPSLLLTLEHLSNEQKKRPLIVEDATLCLSIPYARERADRLGALKGVDVEFTVSSEQVPRSKALKKMSRLLDELLEELDAYPLSYLFGRNWRELPGEEKNIAQRIRMQGILYHSTLWLEHYPIRVL